MYNSSLPVTPVCLCFYPTAGLCFRRSVYQGTIGLPDSRGGSGIDDAALSFGKSFCSGSTGRDSPFIATGRTKEALTVSLSTRQVLDAAAYLQLGYSVREVVEEVILTNYVIAGEQLVARSLVQMV